MDGKAHRTPFLPEHGPPLSCCRGFALAMRAGRSTAAYTRARMLAAADSRAPRALDERPPPLALPQGLTPQPPSVFLQGRAGRR
jgi:hypothetical protein